MSSSTKLSVAKSIMFAICCGTMVNSTDGYGVTMFMFRFASALAVCKDVLVLSQACPGGHESVAGVPLLYHKIYVRDRPSLI